MKVLDTDLTEITKLYNNFIKMMVKDFYNNYSVSINNAASFIIQLYKEVIVINKNEQCPDIDYLSSLGVYCLYGYQVCRTTNSFLNDFMNEIGLDAKLKPILIDEKNDWHIVDLIHANHVVVNIKNNKTNLFLDLNNDLYFESINGEITNFSFENKQIVLDYNKYTEIINQVQNILNKYLLYKDLGIERVYTYV